MCDELVDLRKAVLRFASAFDPALVSTGDAARVMSEATVMENSLAVVKAMAAARSAEGGDWKRAGARSPAHDFAKKTGTSVGKAADALDTAKRLKKLEKTARKARAGKLSPEQAAAVADAATADPSAEDKLLDTAETSTLNDLRDECAKTKAAADPDPEGRRKRIHERRYLRTFTDPEGGWNLRIRDNPEVGAAIMAALEPIRDRLFKAARAEGRRETLEAYAADALRELASGANDEQRPAKSAARAKILVRVDFDALLRGYPIGEEVCELVGFGPIAASALRDMLDTGDPFLAAIITRGTSVVGVAHLGRRATAFQQSALEWLYPKCANLACSSSAFLENDHRVDWAASKVTVFDLLDRLCPHDHDLKSRANWALVDGRGRRAFVPPDDPRHPKHAKGRAPPQAA